MRPIQQTVAGSPGASPVIPIDQYNAPTNIGIGVKVVGTTTFQVQHTFDDVFAPTFDPATATWYNHPTLAGSANIDGNYMAPPRGIRLITSAGAGSATMTLVQSGASG